MTTENSTRTERIAARPLLPFYAAKVADPSEAGTVATFASRYGPHGFVAIIHGRTSDGRWVVTDLAKDTPCVVPADYERTA